MCTKHILKSTIIANIEVCFIQMQCIIEALMCKFKTFDLIINSCTALQWFRRTIMFTVYNLCLCFSHNEA